MARPTNHTLLLVVAIFFLLGACTPTPPEPDAEQFMNQVATSVASTLTALPTIPAPTNTPLPTPTEPAPPTPTSPTLTFTLQAPILPTTTPIIESDYACDIIEQRPRDDTVLRRHEDFDVRWTIVNTGTRRWERGTFLEYQTGPEMTEETRVDLPRLKPGEEYEVILDAKAPDELDRQIMVWAVHGPGIDDDTTHWMCYPYVRIIVER